MDRIRWIVVLINVRDRRARERRAISAEDEIDSTSAISLAAGNYWEKSPSSPI
jgi:hypothetical protein